MSMDIDFSELSDDELQRLDAELDELLDAADTTWETTVSTVGRSGTVPDTVALVVDRVSDLAVASSNECASRGLESPEE